MVRSRNNLPIRERLYVTVIDICSKYRGITSLEILLIARDVSLGAYHDPLLQLTFHSILKS